MSAYRLDVCDGPQVSADELKNVQDTMHEQLQSALQGRKGLEDTYASYIVYTQAIRKILDDLEIAHETRYPDDKVAYPHVHLANWQDYQSAEKALMDAGYTVR